MERFWINSIEKKNQKVKLKLVSKPILFKQMGENFFFKRFFKKGKLALLLGLCKAVYRQFQWIELIF